MKLNKTIFGTCVALGLSATALTSCNDALDMEPISQITPEAYYNSASQIEAYLNNYYTTALIAPNGVYMYHEGGWNNGLNKSDANTDMFVQGLNGNTTLFANDHYDTPSAKQLQGYYGNVRAINYVITKAEDNIASGILNGSDAAVKNALGEAYFMRALMYFRILGTYGDAPIVKEVLTNEDEAILANSVRSPRNEVADFILSDMDNAIANLKDRSAYKGQRLNKQAAQVFASRVALYEATFEKYHDGTPRVASGLSGHVSTLLDKAMAYAKPVADAANLTANSHVIAPEPGTIYGWNSYFEMFSQPSLASCEEVLLWKQYDSALGITHDVPYRGKVGCADGFTRNFVQSFLCKDGLPIYASAQYQGDDTYAHVAANRDERLQLFVWIDQYIEKDAKGEPVYFKVSDIIGSNQEIRNITGYQSRKYYTYDPNQTSDDALHGTNACPIFRTTEALLNYMEASAEKNNGQPDNTAMGYWKQLRERAGVSTDIAATVAATDLVKEYDGGNGDFAVYSGTTMVNEWIYNVRRERVNEMFNEAVRRNDLVRWRAYDNLLTKKWIPEGINFWTSICNDLAARYTDATKIKADGSSDANVSAESLSKYIRPYSRNMSATNELANGFNWHKAYYLAPIGVADLSSASADRDVATSVMTQNPYWSTKAGDHALE